MSTPQEYLDDLLRQRRGEIEGAVEPARNKLGAAIQNRKQIEAQMASGAAAYLDSLGQPTADVEAVQRDVPGVDAAKFLKSGAAKSLTHLPPAVPTRAAPVDQIAAQYEAAKAGGFVGFTDQAYDTLTAPLKAAGWEVGPDYIKPPAGTERSYPLWQYQLRHQGATPTQPPDTRAPITRIFARGGQAVAEAAKGFAEPAIESVTGTLKGDPFAQSKAAYKAFIKPQWEQLQQGWAAYQRDQTDPNLGPGMISHEAVGHFLAGITPFFGPMALSGSEKVGKGVGKLTVGDVRGWGDIIDATPEIVMLAAPLAAKAFAAIDKGTPVRNALSDAAAELKVKLLNAAPPEVLARTQVGPFEAPAEGPARQVPTPKPIRPQDQVLRPQEATNAEAVRGGQGQASPAGQAAQGSEGGGRPDLYQAGQGRIAPQPSGEPAQRQANQAEVRGVPEVEARRAEEARRMEASGELLGPGEPMTDAEYAAWKASGERPPLRGTVANPLTPEEILHEQEPATQVLRSNAAARAEAPPQGQISQAARSAETQAETAGQVSGPANVFTEAGREARGLPPTEKQAYTPPSDAYAAGKDVSPDEARALAASVAKSPRPLTTTEVGALGYDRARIINETREARDAASKAIDSGDEATIALAKERLQRAENDYELNDQALAKGGREQSAAFNVRRMLINDDYSYAGVLQRAKIAAGADIPADVRMELGDLTAQLDNAEAKVGDSYRNASFTNPLQDVRYRRAAAESKRLRQKIDEVVDSQAKPAISDYWLGWRRGLLLSSMTTLGKLTSAAGQRFATRLLEEIPGAILSKTPGIRRIAAKAPSEGAFSPKAEAIAFSKAFEKAMVSDTWQKLTTGQSELDVLFKGERTSRPTNAFTEMSGFFGRLHGALKNPVHRTEFFRSLEKRTQAAIKQGVDPHDPATAMEIGAQAYEDANRAIFMQRNTFLDGYNSMLNTWRQSGVAGKALATGARTLFPILRIPVNYVTEAARYGIGGAEALGRVIAAKGVEGLSPAQADAVMRALKKQAVGAGIFTIGYLNADKIGGYYHAGEKRAEGEPQAGGLQVWGVNVPRFLLHSPAMEMLQLGATVRRVKQEQRKGEEKGVGEGVRAGTLGLAEEVPFFGEALRMTRATESSSATTKYIGAMVKSLIVPPDVERIAKAQDDETARSTAAKVMEPKPTKREVTSVPEVVQAAIPGLRKRLPTAETPEEKAFRRRLGGHGPAAAIDEQRKFRRLLGLE